MEKVKEELADIVNYAILIADKYDLDIKQIVLDKIRRNAEKYPVENVLQIFLIRFILSFLCFLQLGCMCSFVSLYQNCKKVWEIKVKL